MEKSRSSLKHSFSDSSRRSTKVKRSRSSRASRPSEEARVSTIKEEVVDIEQNTNYRENLTNVFFESFYSTLVAETKPIRSSCLDASFSSQTMTNPSLSDSTNESSGSFFETIVSTPSKDLSSQKILNVSSQSITETTSTPSCDSACTCCWRVLFKNGNIYEGQLNNGMMEGKGTFFWNDGSIYKGEFRNGYPFGQGKLVLPDLSLYEGQFYMGFFHGVGALNVKSSPILYKGQWKLSQRNGTGWLLYETNNWYEGDWLNNEKHGEGYRHYANGDRYRGGWINDKTSGEGCMMWHDNDYYSGKWDNGYQEGYGQYIWNLIEHKSFVFPNYNWYKGNWISGKRTGAGIMNLGHESGAKLAGTWLDNKKHGPGVMICGNGIVLEKNLLFTVDKPSAFIKNESNDTAKHHSDDSVVQKESAIKTFTSISKQVLSKENLDVLQSESISNITRNSMSIKMSQYVKLLDKNVDNYPPLKIPIHNITHEVDLEYFLENCIRRGVLAGHTTDISIIELEHVIKAPTESTLTPASFVNYLPSNADFGTYNLEVTASQQYMPSSNELKNLIINYLPQLRNVYKMYASLCVNQDLLSFEPVLIRMFLWQLYRDIGVTDQGGVSIVEVDKMLIKNPKSCLETPHDPWEPIYFWQFLQALVGVACMLYTAENVLDYVPSSGFMYHMFKNFLEHKLLTNAGIYQGNCLTHLKNLIPIEAVYRLYKEIGEPHTVDDFLKNSCLKKGQRIPCYKVVNKEIDFEYKAPTGSNIVVLNNELFYLETTHSKINIENEKLNRYEGFYSFSCLGRRKILKTLCNICPQILLPSGRYQLQYRLSFIEFYEVMLLLSFEKVKQNRTSLLEEIKTSSVSEIKSGVKETSRMSTISAKRKKNKK